MDALSDVIRLLRPRSCLVGATDVGGELAIRFPAYEGVFCYSVAFGECWLEIEGDPAPLRLGPGDCVVLPSGRPFRLASDLRLPPTDASVVFGGRPNGSIATYNRGGRCMMFAAHFEFETHFSQFLLGVLPAVLRIHEPQARAALRAAIEQMIEELQQARPGSTLIVEHLAHMTLIKALRFHLAEVAGGQAGWLFALADRQMGPAIAALHAAPARRWTVQSLAHVAAMSRTAFATRFRHTVGVPPMDYLARLRMLIAARMLAEPGGRVSVVGQALGYESESAFSAAFKRVMGCSPRRHAQMSSGSAAAPRNAATATAAGTAAVAGQAMVLPKPAQRPKNLRRAAPGPA